MTNRSFFRAIAHSPLVLASALLVVQASTPVAAQEYHQIKRLGTSEAICRPAINSGEELQAFFANQSDEVLAILADSGWGGDPAHLFQAVEAGNFVQNSYPVGTRVEWMGRRVKGQPMAQPYIEWAGSEPFEAFAMSFESNGMTHEIIVPNACCNVSLVSSEPVPAPVAEAAPVVEEPARAFWPYLAPFIGRQIRDYDPFLVGVEGGIQFPLTEKFALFGQLGASYNTKDEELSPYADIGGDLLFEKGFVGLGIGIWDFDDDRGTRDNTLFLHGGGDTPWTFGTSQVQWFAEGRIFEDATKVEDNNILKAGLRLIWK